MKRVIVLIFALFVFVGTIGCATGDAAKRYDQNINIYSLAPNCNINVTVTTSVDAVIKKTADARADISPTLDIAP